SLGRGSLRLGAASPKPAPPAESAPAVEAASEPASEATPAATVDSGPVRHATPDAPTARPRPPALPRPGAPRPSEKKAGEGATPPPRLGPLRPPAPSAGSLLGTKSLPRTTSPARGVPSLPTPSPVEPPAEAASSEPSTGD